MVEEKVQNLIYGIKRYKSLYEAEFIKYISLPKIINNYEINDKQIGFSEILNNHETKNSTEEENNVKRYDILPLHFNSDIINQPKYNIIKKKLFNFRRKRNRLNNSLKNDSTDVFSFINLNENNIYSNKNQNKSVSDLEQNEKVKTLDISLPKHEILKKNKCLLKVNSHINIKKNIFELINKNDLFQF